MLGLDTNILVRYVVRDDPSQLARVDRILEKDLSKEKPGYVNLVVLVELAWVLERSYRFSRQDVARVMAELLSNEQLMVEQDARVEEALKLFPKTNADFADLLINLVNKAHGCTTTLTLDRDQSDLPTATVIG